MDQVTIIGIDISKRSFQLHGATAEGEPVFGNGLPPISGPALKLEFGAG